MRVNGRKTDVLPSVSFGSFQVSRLIIGGNPLRGYSHFSPELDSEMAAYHTVENTVKTLIHAEAHGINTMLARGDEIIFDVFRDYREAGGNMHWIGLTASEKADVFANIQEIAELEPIAIFFHGSNSDQLWREGKFDRVREYLKAIKDAGFLAGIAAHLPEIPRYVEGEGWEIDFYMSCFYNIAKIPRESILAGGSFVEEPFDDEDREVTINFIQNTSKPCIAYKVLAAGRKCGSENDIRAAFGYAYDRIKPSDMVCTGIFQKNTDQISMNSKIVGQILDS
jgi:hypothetical protein